MSNEIIRAKKKIHELVSNYENLVVTMGAMFVASDIIIAMVLLLAFNSSFSWVFMLGTLVVWGGMIFLMKEHEAETGEKMFWLHDEY